ncbi:serine protease [Sporosarcina sp. P13]|uniref:S1C family serine protease n=1 Tax=Sporosarcina sp. P13 TaxID=2048263 RepID=UPI000C16502F|nr:trypsin-like peptidase domain-containing protein [Sporosarcina sp. P13]PIC65226.1 serine protease [Sporosarcina sp. P13]
MKTKDPLQEELDDEVLQELVLEAQREALEKAAAEKNIRRTYRPFPKWIFWIMAMTLAISTFSIMFQIYSIPAIEFLKTSSTLSKNLHIAEYKKSIVIVATGDSKGTGYSISDDGTILTNYHVIEGNKSVLVSFPKGERFTATVTKTFPSIDMAVINVNGEDLPHLTLADETHFYDHEPITIIGNPLSFSGIANQGNTIDYIQLPDWENPVVMIKAPVYRGNSGSPVINENGEVIGTIFATLDEKSHGKVGLFIPIDLYYDAMENL